MLQHEVNRVDRFEFIDEFEDVAMIAFLHYLALRGDDFVLVRLQFAFMNSLHRDLIQGSAVQSEADLPEVSFAQIFENVVELLDVSEAVRFLQTAKPCLSFPEWLAVVSAALFLVDVVKREVKRAVDAYFISLFSEVIRNIM